MSPLLRLDALHVTLNVDGERRPVLHDVSLDVGAGEAVGLVGESGSGKSMTVRSILRVLPHGAETSGRIDFDGTDILSMPAKDLRRLRSHEVAVIHQDPRAAINPVSTVGDFLVEALVANHQESPRQARARVQDILSDVGIPDASRRMRQYPHELSGGLLQRVAIAAAIAVRPRMILADEPTTALDVTTQSEVMGILDEMRREHGLAMLFITHDLELAGAVCDRIAVMYAGSIVEESRPQALEDHPRHPYSRLLLDSRPRIDQAADRLEVIPGRPISAFEVGPGCALAPRCPYAEPQCTATVPALRPAGEGRVRCLRSEEIEPVLRRSGTEVRDV
ncbi:ABC transporter ATP-binding protein [Kitasatospora sp. NPDC087315]|uniref:ABC transporter ATP-binding protein n=1 Tax=Kitasatospora sp. NPDC087315 TaxID=3364069 RepID=UPI0038127AFE